MTPSPAEREAIRARADAATPGPWVVDDPNSNLVAQHIDGVYHYILKVAPDEFSTDDRPWEENDRNAAFIAHARSDIPALLSHIATLEREREALTEVFERARELVRPQMTSAFHADLWKGLEEAVDDMIAKTAQEGDKT